MGRSQYRCDKKSVSLTYDVIYTWNINSLAVYMNSLLSVLNSRKALSTRDIEIFDAPSHRLLARADRLATVRCWNVPDVSFISTVI